MRKQEERPKLQAGTAGFTFLLWFFTFLSAFVLSMALSIAPGDAELAVGLLISQSIGIIIAVLLWYKQIRYMIAEKKRFHPIRRLGSWFRWLGHFLTPYRSNFRAAGPDQSAIETLITGFRKEYNQFYAGEKPRNNTTQMYRHMLMLHKQRLDKMGLSVENHLTRMKLKEEALVRGFNVKDGKFHHVHAQEYITGRQNYQAQGKQVFSVNRVGCAEYDIIGAQNHGAERERNMFICPGCGAMASAKELLDGCSYCGKKFLIEELKERICNLSFFSDPVLKQKLVGLKISRWTNWGAFLFTLLEMLVMIQMFAEALKEADGPTGILVILVISPLVFGMIFGLVLVVNHMVLSPIRLFVFWLYRKQRERRSLDMQVMKRNLEMMKTVGRIDRGFSLNSFLSNVRNKLAAIHFAESGKQVDVFAVADLSPYLSKYHDVAECVFGAMELCSYQIQNGYRHAKVQVNLSLLHWNGKEMTETKEFLELQLMKAAEYQAKNPFGIHIPVCSNCGASVDLLKGNRCAYCGEKLNIMNLDWCITSYKVISEK